MQLEYLCHGNSPAITGAHNSAIITLEDVRDVTDDKVKLFADYLFKQNVITQEEHKNLEDCNAFDQPSFMATSAKIMKILEVYLLLNSLDDIFTLSLVNSAQDNPKPGIFERMILDLKTNVEIDQKIEYATRILLAAMKHFQSYEKEAKTFDKVIDSMLIKGRFDKANSRLKQIAKALKINQESLIEKLRPHRFTFVLVNAPIWDSNVRKIAIRIGLEPFITVLKVDDIRSQIKMLTARGGEKSPNYKKEIIEYLKFETQKFAYDGLLENAKLLESVYQYPDIQPRPACDLDEKESMHFEDQFFERESENKQLLTANPIPLLENDKKVNLLWAINDLQNNTSIYDLKLLTDTPLDQVLYVISSLPKEEVRIFVLFKLSNVHFPNKNVYKWLEKANKLELNDRYAKLLDFFMNMQKDGDNYLACLEQEEKNREISEEIDRINEFSEMEHRLERLKEILPHVEHDFLMAINVGYDNPIERRQAIRDCFNI